jgi:predicted nucleotidyltransferase
MFLERLAQEFNLDIIYAFGSRAREVADALASKGQALPESLSDVDIGVKPLPGQDLTVSDKVEIAQRVEDMLDVPRVDLVCLPEVDPFLAANVIRGERLYSRDHHRADEYDLYILRRAGDCLHLERERLALIMGEE